MNEIRVKVDDLKPSVSNVRSKHSKEDIQMMADSITHRGIINPPSVAKNGEGKYEVVAGFLRMLGAAKAGVEEIDCLDVTALTPSERTEISLSENVDRRRMTAMQYYAAFNKLFKAGMPVEKIGERFSKTEREVQQLLAIGSLPKKILDLADAEEIGDRTLEALAIANGKDLIRYSKLSAKERPRDWDIQEWLAGEKGRFMEKHALFDLDKYVGPKITDLFAKEDEIWLTDGQQFSDLQETAISAKVKGYADKGYIVEQVEHWQSWAYERVSKKKGGRVVWTQDKRTGAVEFHVGYKRLNATGKAPKAKGSAAKPEAKAEISQAFSAYIRQHRHNGVRGELLDDNKAALVVNICCMLKNHDSWRMDQIHMGAVKGPAYEDDIVAGIDYAAIEEAFLKISKDANPTLLYKMSETELLNRLAIITAWKWQTYSNEFSDTVAKAIGLKDVQNWKPSEAFWKGIKNKTTLIAIAKELKIIHLKDATATAIRKTLIAQVKANGWRPSWLRF